MSSGRHGSWALRRFTWQARSGTSTSRTDYESLTLAFCLATRRCINLGPWLQAFVVEQFRDRPQQLPERMGPSVKALNRVWMRVP